MCYVSVNLVGDAVSLEVELGHLLELDFYKRHRREICKHRDREILKCRITMSSSDIPFRILVLCISNTTT